MDRRDHTKEKGSRSSEMKNRRRKLFSKDQMTYTGRRGSIQNIFLRKKLRNRWQL